MSAAKKKAKVSKPKKSRPARSVSPAVNDADRRRSGRARKSAASAYVERDSSDDDREMWEGVAKWEYEKGGGDDDAMEDEEVSSAEDSDAEEVGRKAPRKSGRAEVGEGDASSELSEPVPSGDEAGDEDDAPEEETPPPTKAKARGGRGAAASATAELPSRPARGKKEAAKPTSTRPRRGRAARRESEDEMEVDSD